MRMHRPLRTKASNRRLRLIAMATPRCCAFYLSWAMLLLVGVPAAHADTPDCPSLIKKLGALIFRKAKPDEPDQFRAAHFLEKSTPYTKENEKFGGFLTKINPETDKGVMAQIATSSGLSYKPTLGKGIWRAATDAPSRLFQKPSEWASKKFLSHNPSKIAYRTNVVGGITHHTVNRPIRALTKKFLNSEIEPRPWVENLVAGGAISMYAGNKVYYNDDSLFQKWKQKKLEEKDAKDQVTIADFWKNELQSNYRYRHLLSQVEDGSMTQDDAIAEAKYLEMMNTAYGSVINNTLAFQDLTPEQLKTILEVHPEHEKFLTLATTVPFKNMNAEQRRALFLAHPAFEDISLIPVFGLDPEKYLLSAETPKDLKDQDMNKLISVGHARIAELDVIDAVTQNNAESLKKIAAYPVINKIKGDFESSEFYKRLKSLVPAKITQDQLRSAALEEAQFRYKEKIFSNLHVAKRAYIKGVLTDKPLTRERIQDDIYEELGLPRYNGTED